MSNKLRVKGLLMNRLSMRMERSYQRYADAVFLADVPCEMKFESAHVFFSHESEKHHYLPVMRLVGYVTEVKADLPFGASSLYFDESDRHMLCRDFVYYPSPKELNHLVDAGFYSGNFEVPSILRKNTYSFPGKISVLAFPPDSKTLRADGRSDMDADKMDTPVIFVRLDGTGIDKSQDRVLKDYGIEIDKDFPTYAITAEFSGYTEPSLIEYIKIPEKEAVAEAKRSKDYYLSEEEEAEMLRFHDKKKEMAQKEPSVTYDPRQPSPEDVMLANATMAITRRVKEAQHEKEQEKVLSETMELSKPEKQPEPVKQEETSVEQKPQQQEIVPAESVEKVSSVDEAQPVVQPVETPVAPAVVESEVSKTESSEDGMLHFDDEQETAFAVVPGMTAEERERKEELESKKTVQDTSVQIQQERQDDAEQEKLRETRIQELTDQIGSNEAEKVTSADFGL